MVIGHIFYARDRTEELSDGSELVRQLPIQSELLNVCRFKTHLGNDNGMSRLY